MNKQDLDRSMKTIKTFQKAIPGFFNPISGEQEESIDTYILSFSDDVDAEEFDNEVSSEQSQDGGPGHVESYLNYRIVQIIPYIDTEDDGYGNDSLEDNKTLLIQNRTLSSLAAMEMKRAYLWLFNFLSN